MDGLQAVFTPIVCFGHGNPIVKNANHALRDFAAILNMKMGSNWRLASGKKR